MDHTSITDYNLNCYAVLLDISLEDFKKAMAETGMSGEEIVEKYFESLS
ncbi:MAG TPA: hypothetical protein VGD22_02465 [Sphingobacteriaceae bacterium]